MEKFSIGGLIVVSTVAWYKVKSFWAFWGPVIEEIVQEVENKAKDGVIDLADRKALAMSAIALVAQKKGKKLGILAKWGISWLVNRYAGKLLPHDIVIPKVVEEATVKGDAK